MNRPDIKIKIFWISFNSYNVWCIQVYDDLCNSVSTHISYASHWKQPYLNWSWILANNTNLKFLCVVQIQNVFIVLALNYFTEL